MLLFFLSSSLLNSQILKGLQHLHKYHFVHRDIKCENVLIAQDGRAFLADFGLAVHTGSFEALRTKVFYWYAGSEHCMAPEVLRLKKYPQDTVGQGYDYKCDIWSLGVTMRDLYTRYFEFKNFRPRSPHENPYCLLLKVQTYLSAGSLYLRSFVDASRPAFYAA